MGNQPRQMGTWSFLMDSPMGTLGQKMGMLG